MYSPKWLFLIPGIILMILGIISSAFLVAKPITVRDITLDVHTLLYSSSAILIGFQFILFYGLTKIFAVENGLLPKSERYNKLFKYLNLENGLILGVLLFLFGFFKSFQALTAWQDLSFGDLNPQDVLRIIIPAVLSIQLGLQIVLFSLFF